MEMSLSEWEQPPRSLEVRGGGPSRWPATFYRSLLLMGMCGEEIYTTMCRYSKAMLKRVVPCPTKHLIGASSQGSMPRMSVSVPGTCVGSSIMTRVFGSTQKSPGKIRKEGSGTDMLVQ